MLRMIVQISRGILAVREARRCFLLGIVLADLALIGFGATVFGVFLLERPLFFALYWLFCGWLTLLMGLMAGYELLTVSAEARKLRKQLERDLLDDQR